MPFGDYTPADFNSMLSFFTGTNKYKKFNKVDIQTADTKSDISTQFMQFKHNVQAGMFFGMNLFKQDSTAFKHKYDIKRKADLPTPVWLLPLSPEQATDPTDNAFFFLSLYI